MMSSVIPARLQFQCGHAALVTLPRVKGETASQRNARVVFEKAAALGRQCDFCGPVAAALATPLLVEAVNGVHEPVATVLDRQAVEVPEVVVAVASEPDVAELIEVVEPAETVELVVVAESEPVQPLATLELVAQPTVDVEVAPSPAAARPSKATTNGSAVRTRSPRKRRVATPDAVARGRRFLVEYQVERVLHAVDIHDALRKAAVLGASDVVAITRDD